MSDPNPLYEPPKKPAPRSRRKTAAEAREPADQHPAVARKAAPTREPRAAQASTEVRKGTVTGGPWLIRGEATDTVEVRYYEWTAMMRDEAMEKAVWAFKAENGTEAKGFYPTVFERSLAKRLIKTWSLPTPPTAGGWDLITDPELKSKISRLIGLDSALQSYKQDTREAKDAKNSSSAESPREASTPA